MICCDTCPLIPTCDELEAQPDDDEWGEEYDEYADEEYAEGIDDY